ncbi:Late competence development protein ComFB [Syntrophomonas zehnderi OL-4]|uniref:Late competence development protein ComFB n=1 Tax=Syntrophomonas zehnderi OL-4 TaxID=690567 RepID=A0A0E4C943_9FIRM|nr:competence protein ComFB [Syntrophomonas zehnderi]CFX84974.1 Late competence development protein ComFB [Syntrophomonas zehnderi OL-4]
MAVINILEKIVWDNLGDVIKRKAGACDCDICRADMAAYALNHLKPRYVATSKGETFSKAAYLDNQLYMTVIVALTEAVEVVSAKPRHEGK